MNIDRPPQIKPHHLSRTAFVYCRQSSTGQVANNPWSAEFQRGLRRYPEIWGWPSERIVVVEDAGLSGTAAAHRPGYLEILEKIKAGIGGAVWVADHSRLGRNLVEWLHFLEECARHDTLLFIKDQPYDIGNNGQLFATRIQALVSEYETTLRLENIRRGIAAKVAAGRAVTRPPAGFVTLPDGFWELDPDQGVQDSIGIAFSSRCTHSSRVKESPSGLRI